MPLSFAGKLSDSEMEEMDYVIQGEQPLNTDENAQGFGDGETNYYTTSDGMTYQFQTADMQEDESLDNFDPSEFIIQNSFGKVGGVQQGEPQEDTAPLEEGATGDIQGDLAVSDSEEEEDFEMVQTEEDTNQGFDFEEFFQS